jgi:pimeloyl-ACP methyl ester carboxylesterase
MLKPDFFTGYDNMLANITSQIPSHVVWGARDPYLPLVNADKFARAAVTVLPNQGHWVPLTAPISLTSALAELLAH